MLPEGLRMTLGTSINSHCFHRCFLSYTASMTSVVDKNKHHIHIICISCKVLQRFDSLQWPCVQEWVRRNRFQEKHLESQDTPDATAILSGSLYKAENETLVIQHPCSAKPCSPRFLEGVVDRWRVCKYGWPGMCGGREGCAVAVCYPGQRCSYICSGETPCLPQRDYPRVTPLDQNVADNHIPGVI